MNTAVVGVDGGGTHTRAVLLDGEGGELARGRAEGAVVRLDDIGRAARAVAGAVRDAAGAAGVALPLTSLWAGLAGAGREDARAAIGAALRAQGLARTVTVGTDVEAAFADAFGHGPGMLLVAGTGSMGLARAPDGVVSRVGGWGDQLGDEGSGFWIGREALRSVARAHDGRGPATALTEAVLGHLGLVDPTGLIAWAAAAQKSDVAALVPRVVETAALGDPVAEEVLHGAVEALVDHVDALVERAGGLPAAPPLALWGGLLWEEGPLRKPLLEALDGLGLELFRASIDPPMGAARMALRATASAT